MREQLGSQYMAALVHVCGVFHCFANLLLRWPGAVCLVFHDGGGKPPEGKQQGGGNEMLLRTRRDEAKEQLWLRDPFFLFVSV